jgi:hypothetical protein
VLRFLSASLVRMLNNQTQAAANVFNTETGNQGSGTEGPTFGIPIPGLGFGLPHGNSNYCAERPPYRGRARPGNIAKGYVTSYTECRSITVCLVVDLDVEGVWQRAGETVTFDLSYARKPTRPANAPGVGRRMNVNFLVDRNW